jgi:hypothetical protein
VPCVPVYAGALEPRWNRYRRLGHDPDVIGAPMMQTALAYRERGLSVVPIGRDKKPLVKWTQYQDELPHPDALAVWWDKWPDANIGIVTGAVSGLVVFDYDHPSALEHSITFGLEARTWSWRTGRGWQRAFAHPGGGLRIGNRTGFRPHLDVRGDGGYCIVPPSLHANGLRYTWLTSPEDLPLAPLPDAVLAILLTQPPSTVEPAPEDTIPEGQRNDVLWRMARALHAKHFTPAAILAALLVENRGRCQPPLPESEVRALAERAAAGPDRAEFAAADARAPSAAPLPSGKVLRGTALFSVQVAEPEWLIGRLFSHGHQHMIVGASQGAKSWLLFDLAVAYAHPSVSTFLDQPVLRHGRALLESWEMGQSEDVRRVQKLVRGHDLPTCAEELILVSEPPSTLRDESYFRRRCRELQDWGVTLYGIDSLSEAAGMELNDNTAYTEWWRTRVKPILDLGITVVWSHLKGHAKPGVQDRDSASRGATQIRALSTGVLELRQLTDVLFAVKHNKHRNSLALSFGSLKVDGQIEDPFVRLVVQAATTESKDVLARGLLTQLGLEAAITGQSLTRKAIELRLNDASKPKDERVSRKIYEAVLAQMVGDGLFQATKQGNAHAWAWTGPTKDEDETPD